MFTGFVAIFIFPTVKDGSIAQIPIGFKKTEYTLYSTCKLSLPIAFTHCTQVFLLQAFITDMLQMQMASDTSFPALLFLQISPAHSISSDPVLFPAHPRSLRILSSAILHD